MSEPASGSIVWERLRPGARAYMLSVLAALSFVGGLFVAQPLIFVSIPVTVLLGFTVLRSRDPRVEIELTRTTEKVRMREGESTRVRLRAKNSGPRAIPLLQVRDRVQPELRGQNTCSGFSFALKVGETKDFYYEVFANTFGVHSLGPLTLSVQDSTGLFESRAQLESYSRMVVFPESVERLTHFAIRPQKTRPWPGEIVARRAGIGMDHYSIRPSMPGESRKWINWRASARHFQEDGKFLVNEHMAELGAEVLLVVDAGGALGTESGRDPVVTYSAKAALSIAERLLHDRNRVGLLTTGANRLRVPAAYGKRQFDRIALSLLQLEPDDTDIQWWMERSIHFFFPNVSQIIFVSALMNANSVAAAAEITRYGRHDVIIVSPNPLGVAKPGSKNLRSKEWRIAWRLARLERTTNLDLLRAANALVIDWTTSASLEQVVEVNGRALARHAMLSARRR